MSLQFACKSRNGHAQNLAPILLQKLLLCTHILPKNISLPLKQLLDLPLIQAFLFSILP